MNVMTESGNALFAGKRVLVVDDSASMRELLRESLYAAGFDRVWCAADGARALAVLADNSVDAIICDNVMEPVDGLSVIRNLRANSESFGQLPILLLTGHADRNVVEQAREAGVDGILVKPVARGRLLDRLAAVMAERQGEDAVAQGAGGNAVVWDPV